MMVLTDTKCAIVVSQVKMLLQPTILDRLQVGHIYSLAGIHSIKLT